MEFDATVLAGEAVPVTLDQKQTKLLALKEPAGRYPGEGFGDLVCTYKEMSKDTFDVLWRSYTPVVDKSVNPFLQRLENLRKLLDWSREDVGAIYLLSEKYADAFGLNLIMVLMLIRMVSTATESVYLREIIKTGVESESWVELMASIMLLLNYKSWEDFEEGCEPIVNGFFLVNNKAMVFDKYFVSSLRSAIDSKMVFTTYVRFGLDDHLAQLNEILFEGPLTLIDLQRTIKRIENSSSQNQATLRDVKSTQETHGQLIEELREWAQAQALLTIVKGQGVIVNVGTVENVLRRHGVMNPAVIGKFIDLHAMIESVKVVEEHDKKMTPAKVDSKETVQREDDA